MIRGDRLDPAAAQTPGVFRQVAIDHARVGAQRIWAGTVRIEPAAKTGVLHHGALESVIFVLRGRSRMRWGERLEYVAEAGRVTSSSCRPVCPMRRPTPTCRSRSNACWSAPTRRFVVVNIADVDPIHRAP